MSHGVQRDLDRIPFLIVDRALGYFDVQLPSDVELPSDENDLATCDVRRKN